MTCFPCPSNLLRSFACLMLFASNYFWASLITSTAFFLSRARSILIYSQLAIIHTVAVSSPQNWALFSFRVCMNDEFIVFLRISIFAKFNGKTTTTKKTNKLAVWIPFRMFHLLCRVCTLYKVKNQNELHESYRVKIRLFLGFPVISALNTQHYNKWRAQDKRFASFSFACTHPRIHSSLLHFYLPLSHVVSFSGNAQCLLHISLCICSALFAVA